MSMSMSMSMSMRVWGDPVARRRPAKAAAGWLRINVRVNRVWLEVKVPGPHEARPPKAQVGPRSTAWAVSPFQRSWGASGEHCGCATQCRTARRPREVNGGACIWLTRCVFPTRT